MRTAPAALCGFAVAALLAAGLALFRASDPPPPRELVPWEPYSSLGPPPWDRPVLLDFSADWCGPCREMKLDTFRDPALVRWLEERGVRPVRAEDSPATREEFAAATKKWGLYVDAYPTILLISKEGRTITTVRGRKPASAMIWELQRGWARENRRVRWYAPGEPGAVQPGRLTLRHLENWWTIRDRMEATPDWTGKCREPFAAWINGNFNLLSDHLGEGAAVKDRQLYDEHGVNRIPTLLVFAPGGELVAKFEGMEAVQGAPEAIARLARELGFPVPDPPPPMAREWPPPAEGTPDPGGTAPPGAVSAPGASPGVSAP